MEEGGQALSAVISICDRAMKEARQMLDAIPKHSTPAPSTSSTSSALNLTKGLVFYSEDKKYKLVAYERQDSRSSLSVQSRKGQKQKPMLSDKERKRQEDSSSQSRKGRKTMVRVQKKSQLNTVQPNKSYYMVLAWNVQEDRFDQLRKGQRQKTVVAVQPRNPQDDSEVSVRNPVSVKERKSQVVPVQPKKMAQDRKGQTPKVADQSKKSQEGRSSQSGNEEKTLGSVREKTSQVNTAQNWKGQKACLQRTCSSGERMMRQVFEHNDMSYKLILEAHLGRNGKLKQIVINGKKLNI